MQKQLFVSIYSCLMKSFSSKYLKIITLVICSICVLSSCKNERQHLVDESVRLINKATARIQDLSSLELNNLKDIPDELQDSLAVLQNKHPDVILTDEDARLIRAAMNKFTEAQENAIKYFTLQIDELEETVVKLSHEAEVKAG